MLLSSFHLENNIKFIILNKKSYMYGKQQWRGREVEGRYSDIMTLFIRELGDGIDVEDLRDYPHYYFTIEYVSKMIQTKSTAHFEAIREILDTTNGVVTIEANKDTLDGN